MLASGLSIKDNGCDPLQAASAFQETFVDSRTAVFGIRR